MIPAGRGLGCEARAPPHLGYSYLGCSSEAVRSSNSGVADGQALNAGCHLTGPWTVRAGRDLGDHRVMRLVSLAGMPGS